MASVRPGSAMHDRGHTAACQPCLAARLLRTPPGPGRAWPGGRHPQSAPPDREHTPAGVERSMCCCDRSGPPGRCISAPHTGTPPRQALHGYLQLRPSAPGTAPPPCRTARAQSGWQGRSWQSGLHRACTSDGEAARVGHMHCSVVRAGQACLRAALCPCCPLRDPHNRCGCLLTSVASSSPFYPPLLTPQALVVALECLQRPGQPLPPALLRSLSVLPPALLPSARFVSHKRVCAPPACKEGGSRAVTGSCRPPRLPWATV